MMNGFQHNQSLQSESLRISRIMKRLLDYLVGTHTRRQIKGQHTHTVRNKSEGEIGCMTG